MIDRTSPRTPARTARGVAVMLLALGAAPALRADGVAYLVKDVDSQVSPVRTLGLEPRVALGPVALAAPASAHYMDLDPGELWVTDGTTPGTRLIRHLQGRGLRDAVALGGGALLVADSPATGEELWWTDGTTAGTRLVRDIDPGPSSSMPALVGVLNGVAYLAANDGVHGRELWRSDGTPGGTWLFADLNPGAGGSLAEWNDPDRAGGIYSDRLYFAADDGVHGRELWRSDGHPAGTYLLKSIVPGAGGGSPRRFRTAAGRLFFVADEATHGAELWTSDGSALGTVLVRDIAPGAQGSEPRPLGRVPGRLVFAVGEYPDRSLWVSDGTEAGTSSIRELGIVPEHPGATVGTRVLFVGYESGSGQTAWVTDGTSAGTQRLRNDLEGVGEIWSVGAFALFVASRDQERELWRTDGTPSGTVSLGSGCDEISPPVAVVVGWLYSCRSYVGPHGWDVTSLQRTDGTPAGTGEIVFDLPRGEGSRPGYLTGRRSGAVFWTEESGWDFVLSDGTEAGTRPATYTGTGLLGSFSGGARLVDGELVLASGADDVGDGQIFRTDGELVSAVTVIDNGGVWPSGLTRVGDDVFFVTDSLWRTDGTASGTARVRQDLTGFELTDVFGTLWLVADHEWGTPASLWESGGTLATTIEHPLDLELESEEPNGLTPLDPATGSLVFRALEGLYLFDPVADEARRFRDLSPTAPPRYEPFPRASVDGRLYFFDGNPNGVCALWKSDGTPAGTVKVKNIGVWGCWPVEIVAMGGRLYLRGCDAGGGCELWRSDGTPEGTLRIVDLDPGVFSSMPAELTVVGDRIYFSACDAAHGCEPWVTTGTAAGTHRLGDIAPGAHSSGPSQLAASDRHVFFSADDGTGSELWAVPREIFYDGFESGSTARW